MNIRSLPKIVVSTGFLAVLLTAPAAGCRRPAAAKAPAAAASQPAATKVAKIVFVGKEHACDCTRKAVDASWTALQRALGASPPIPVERMSVDTEPTKVEPYRSQKAIMALPAIYFVDGAGSVVDTLQGEVDEAQIKAILGKGR
jgi:hypothetical protein